MTPLELTKAVRELQAKVAELENKNKVVQQQSAALKEGTAPSVKMCPKCGEKPAYYFHVKNCTPNKKNKNDGADKETQR